MTAPDPLAAVNQVLKHTTVEYLDRPRAAPFVKWAGGKRSLVPEIVKLLPEFGDYWEPFVGGGAVFFALDSLIQKAHLSDINLELMLTYQMLRKRPKEVIEALREHERNHGRRYYLRVRNKQHDEQDPVLLAARFIYLNKTCYNGLYRVNKQGQFNVPIGRHKNPLICDEDNLLAVSKVLKKVNLKIETFSKVSPKQGDLIYCDPPYDGTYNGYTGAGFDDDDQKELRDECVKWRESGCHVIVSNSATDLIRQLYKEFKLHEVSASRPINSDSNGRGKVTDLLIVS